MAGGADNPENVFVSLTSALVAPRLSVLGRNPFTQAHVYTTATLSRLQLADLDALREFPHIQHVHCCGNALRSLRPLQHLALLLSVDASDNELTELLDFDTPKCTSTNAWEDGGTWIGSLLRRADLRRNRIERMRDLSVSHPFLQELRLAHNGIARIEGVAHLRFLRVLDLSHNRLTSTQGLVTAPSGDPSDDASTLEALETLVLSHNKIATVDEVALLPRLERLDIAHNKLQQLHSIASCARLQQLDLSSNDLTDVNELNHLMPLRYLQQLALVGCPLVAREGSTVFYRARVLRRLQQLVQLDGDPVSAREKVKAYMMHGGDVAARQCVFAKHLPGQQFANFLPPLEFDDDEELVRFEATLAANGEGEDKAEQHLDDRTRELQEASD